MISETNKQLPMLFVFLGFVMRYYFNYFDSESYFLYHCLSNKNECEKQLSNSFFLFIVQHNIYKCCFNK